jgi:hypothetical protein
MLTRHGWTAVAAALFAFAIGRVFGLIELYVLGTGLIATVLVALITVGRRLPAVTVQRVARPDVVSVGEPARVDIQVTNVSRKRSPHLQLWEPVGVNGGAPMQLAALGPGEAASAAYRVPTSRRGLLTAGPLRAQRRDVLGLAVRSIVLAGADDILVVPQHVHLPFPAVGSAGRLGQHLRMKAWGQSGGEFHSLREYVPGDDLRRINWKASARSEDLFVRETALEGVRRCTVVLDTDRRQYDGDSFEMAVSAAASVALSSASTSLGTRLVANGVDLRGPDVGSNALRWLAVAQPDDDVLDYAALSRGAGEGMGLVVVVSGSAGSPAVASVRAGIGPDETLVVVSVGSAEAGRDAATSLGRTTMTADGSSLTSLINTWAALVAGNSTVRAPA